MMLATGSSPAMRDVVRELCRFLHQQNGAAIVGMLAPHFKAEGFTLDAYDVAAAIRWIEDQSRAPDIAEALAEISETVNAIRESQLRWRA